MSKQTRPSRRSFVASAGLLPAAAAQTGIPATPQPAPSAAGAKAASAIAYPRRFEGRQLRMIAFPIGGIGTGSISLGGRGQLRDWEIFNRPDKGNVPMYCFFSIWAKAGKAEPVARVLESKIQPPYEVNYRGLGFLNVPGLPRLASGVFEGDYPFARIAFSDRKLPVQVRLEAFNPLIPDDPDASGMPIAVLRYHVRNSSAVPVQVSIAYSQDNPAGPGGHQCEFRQDANVSGLLQRNPFIGARDPLAGSFALAVRNEPGQTVTYLKNWKGPHLRAWPILFWDDFKADGQLTETGAGSGSRVSSLCAQQTIEPGREAAFTFLLSWHFPNRTPARCGWRAPEGHENDVIGNYYCTQFADAWAAAAAAGERLPDLESRTRAFVAAVRQSTLPSAVIEAAMANISTLKTATCFRTADGRFYGFEGCADQNGCCSGNCTHVWNYEMATAFLFPSLARSMRESEFGFNTDDRGCMSFRQMLPDGISRAGQAAADGQMGSVMRLYRDWRMSGNTEWLRRIWPKAKKAIEFAWVANGWDGDRDGVMEGVQHNTYDIEFYGPNPQCGVWYLGALRAGVEMARAMGDEDAAREYRRLYEQGSRWIDENLFNGEYYIQQVRAHTSGEIAEGLVVNRAGLVKRDQAPPFQVGDGCLVDQLVGQYFAHLAGLGYLLKAENVKKAIQSVYRHNFRTSLEEHESVQRVFALNDEAALLICSFPKGNRPEVPFWFFSETMTGFEYQAAIHLCCEGMVREGVEVIEAIRRRYDGERRNPWNEAECGHHYSRAMASWAAIPALAGFDYSAVEGSVRFAPRVRAGAFRTFWSVPGGWGTFSQQNASGKLRATLDVSEGALDFREFRLGWKAAAKPQVTVAGRAVEAQATPSPDGIVIRLPQKITVRKGERLEIRI